MSALELKIPPVLLFVVVAFLMWLASVWLPGIELPIAIRIVAFIIFAGTGAVVAIAGVKAFARIETTVNPTTPEKSSSLVTSGIYGRTRNPMYVGLLLALVGWGLFLSRVYSLVLCVGFVVYLNQFQIKREEEVLTTMFGLDYQRYKQQVRRWF
jgi:protein-S-isoprenylcysteine O-methyltransferase Ste14